jgi:hypothetical protein
MYYFLEYFQIAEINTTLKQMENSSNTKYGTCASSLEGTRNISGVCVNSYDMCNKTAPKIFLTKKDGEGQENETKK